jgi:hypothetical protein
VATEEEQMNEIYNGKRGKKGKKKKRRGVRKSRKSDYIQSILISSSPTTLFLFL